MHVVYRVYVGGGVAMAVRAGGDRSLKGHPHYHRWVALWGLVADGVHFTRSRGARRGGSAGRERLLQEGRGGKVARVKKTKIQTAGEERGPSREAAEKKEPKSKRKSEKKSTRAPADGAAATASAEPSGPAPALPAAASGTQAGDGGRWVHVPG